MTFFYPPISPTAAGPQERVDSGTAVVTITPSAISERHAVDTGTAVVTITPSATEVVPKTTGTYRFSIAPLSTPQTRTQHKVIVRAAKTNAGHTGTVKIQVYEGGTARTAEIESSAISTTPTDYTIAIPDADAANIVSYNDLEVRARGFSSTSDPVTVRIYQAWLEIPEASPAFIDSGTVPVTITPSATEQRESTDASTAPLIVTPAGAEYTEVVDAATAVVTITPSGVDVKEQGGDSATVPVTITPSATEVVPRTTGVYRFSISPLQVPQTRTEHKIMVRAAKTNAAHVGTVKVQLYEGATPITAEIESTAVTTTPTDYTLSIPDADAEDISSYNDLEVRARGFSSTSDPTVFRIYQAWVEIPAASPAQIDSGTVPVTITPSAVSVHEAVDSGTVLVDIQPSGTDEYAGGGTQYTEAATAFIDIQPAGTETAQFVDTGTGFVDIQASGTEGGYVDAGNPAVIDIQVSGVHAVNPGDNVFPSEGPYIQDIVHFIDSGTAFIDIQPSGTEVFPTHWTDTATAFIDVQPSGTEVATTPSIDAATVVITLTPSAFEVWQPQGLLDYQLTATATKRYSVKAVNRSELMPILASKRYSQKAILDRYGITSSERYSEKVRERVLVP